MLNHDISCNDQLQSNLTSIPVLQNKECTFQDNVSSIQDFH